MEWGQLLSAVVGAGIALSGALLVEGRRDRGQRTRDRDLDRWRTYVDFALSLDAAHNLLRAVARDSASIPDRLSAANDAVHVSGLYSARERLLMAASSEVTVSGERTFLCLAEIRNAVRTGASLQSPQYHRAYHSFAEALWRFRSAVRIEFGGQALSSQVMDRVSWSERETCIDCNRAGPEISAAS